ncbi:hypothetical protein FRC14_000577 [Serendipita sp. 396]|nr:hypothetical protein FRC14_000577 [Serendipita sp. 396]KAG8788934.1 hypothetical protein FRC15_000966 [Serendipita sp. 397]KAG8804123.1 hypothetical protein FRC16_000512 [Serendipita sp. 398]KAG8826042.1 hypothetical protein FRC19_009825 [Serendipita sp. 401]KAG8829558.1 hypothetical protein FRC18_009232 [Serendipita sp. 400]KAG8851066.1 hypothetical protein FRB91_008512 [Serendipita sp. 411]KAG8876868.1 hypothetical protein FRC20_000573 [Serendipita sp. 405]KAG9056832.1 hypothetical prot
MQLLREEPEAPEKVIDSFSRPPKKIYKKLFLPLLSPLQTGSSPQGAGLSAPPVMTSRKQEPSPD